MLHNSNTICKSNNVSCDIWKCSWILQELNKTLEIIPNKMMYSLMKVQCGYYKITSEWRFSFPTSKSPQNTSQIGLLKL